jgi:integrase
MRNGVVEQRHGRACSGAERCGCPWSYRIDDREGVDGRRRQIRKSGFRTMTLAREKLADAQRRMAAGEEVGGSLRVGEYLASWLDAKEAAGRKASTIAQYRDLTKRFLTPHLGHVKLSDLRATHVEKMLGAMEQEGRGLVTRRRTVAVLSSALGSAVKRRLVPWNVCTQIEQAPEDSEPRPVWDVEQVRRFLASVQGDRLAALWRLYCLVGVRRGEGVGLGWDAVDLEAGELRINRSLGEVGGQLSWGTPKTANGRRTIALDPGTVTALRTHRARQGEEKLALGAGYRDEGLVFAAEDGRPIWPGYVSDRFHALADLVELPRIRLHDLRHSAASLALAAGIDLKTVSSNLGHAGISITADRYSHVLPAVARAAAEKVASLIDEGRPA